jgi:hypothetical protein
VCVFVCVCISECGKIPWPTLGPWPASPRERNPRGRTGIVRAAARDVRVRDVWLGVRVRVPGVVRGRGGFGGGTKPHEY